MPVTSKSTLGQQAPTKIEAYLRLIGDDEAADRLFPPGGSGQGFGFSWGEEIWGLSGVSLGFIPPLIGSDDHIQDAMTIKADGALRDTRIRILIDQFWVQRYPGRGRHKILCEFTGKNQCEPEPEALRYAMRMEANDQSTTGVAGSPIFVGVAVGRNGISFEGKTINIGSSKDEDFLAALDSDAVKQGLSLLATVQPVLSPFVGLAGSLVGAALRRSENKSVFDFKLGLDFSDSQTGAKLREGSFVVVQSDPKSWSWKNVAWDADRKLVVDRESRAPIPYNYLIFRVARFEE